MTGLFARLLRGLEHELPAGRSDWAAALLAEADAVPGGWARVRWLAGGLRLMGWFARRIGYGALVVTGAVAAVWWDWRPGSTNPATPVDRVATIATVAMLVVLPWVARGRGLFGPGGESRISRAVRVCGYTAMCLLVLAIVGTSRFAGARFEHYDYADRSEMVTGNVFGALMIFGLLTAYTAGILFTTSRRLGTGPRALGVGAAAGALAGLVGYVMAPFGSMTQGWAVLGFPVVLAAPLVAGWLAAEAGASEDTRLRQGLVSGLWTGMGAALTATVLTIFSMLLAPGRVTLIWANPDPRAPHGTPFEIQMSVGDTAGRYLAILILGPIVGVVGGIVGGIGVSARRG